MAGRITAMILHNFYARIRYLDRIIKGEKLSHTQDGFPVFIAVNHYLQRRYIRE